MIFAPAATGIGEAASVTEMSALEITVAMSVARSFRRLASFPPLIVAVFVSVAGADWDTLRFNAIDGYPLAADRESDRVQLTVCPEITHAHPDPVALIGVTPIGSVSFIVTGPLVAP